MSCEKSKFIHNPWLTVPNLLSLFRLLLIPLIIWLYFWRKAYYGVVGILLLSGLTDILDGYIARKFNMISNIGKVLDPLADKLTQGAVFLCLGIRYPILILLILVMVLKEIASGIVSLVAFRRSKQIKSAAWHGKVTTGLLYLTMLLHLLWGNVPGYITVGLTSICIFFMMISLILYIRRSVLLIKTAKQHEREG